MRLALQVSGRVLVGHLGLEEAGSERVDADSLAGAPLLGQVAGQPDDRGLARAVRGLRQTGGGEPENAGDVDDRAAGLHDPAAGLRHPVRSR